MAILTASTDFDPTVQPTWTVFYASGTASQFSMWDNLKTQSFTGSFTYPDSTHVRGTVKSLELDDHVNPERHVIVTGLAVDAATVQTKVIAGSGLYSLLLAGDDTINGGKRLFGFAGNDKLILSSGTYADGGVGTDTLAFTFQTQASLLTRRADWTSGEASGSATMANIEHLSGSAYNDTLAGDAADNVLDGLGGVDTVSYAGLSTAVVVDLSTGVATGQGRDTLKGFENAVGGGGADLLLGNSLGNRLEGGTGIDTLKGGLGNDTYCATDTQDVFVEAADAGIDTVESRIDWTLGSLTIENLVLAGSAVRGTGHAGANRITGNALANQLDGKAGADTLVGGQGNDSYQIDNAGDRVIEVAGEGNDTVTSLVSHTLAANLEYLVLGGTAAINGTGNALSNLITGNAAANVLSGGGGTDTLRGGAGDDIYDVSASGTVVIGETSGGGTDLVRSARSMTLASSVENLTLTGTNDLAGTGNTLANLIIGNAGNNTLDGGAGTDTLKGGAGYDVYVVDRSTDVVYEAANQGEDEIRSSVSFTLSANVEKLTLTGTADINGTGSSLGNYLTGNSGDNRLNGAGGIDIYYGSAGNDTYVIDNDGESIFDEDTTGGNDTIEVGFSYSLESYYGIENLVVTGSFDNWLVGNALDNRLTGNAGANTLEGGAGADTLIGGAGNDLFQVVSGEDVVIEAAGGGLDTVELVGGSVPYTLASNLENLRGYGQLTGNGLANHIEGGWGTDTINGGAGADTMEGGYDDDTYYVDNAGDLILDDFGLSIIFSSISYTAAADMQARITLQGGAHLNATALADGCQLNGNSGNNILTSGSNGDLNGGAGNDTYIVGEYSHVWEDGSAGYDIVKTVGCSFDLSMTYAEIEEIRLGSGNVNATGNLWNNLLVGGAGDNRLDGGTGIDTASFSNANAHVVIDLGAGTATGFGNDTLINIDAVIGSALADTLRGGDGIDTLTGGGGGDRFQFDNLLAADVITDFVHGVDKLQVVMSGLSIGDGDLVVDGAVTIAAPGGHAAAAELVVASTALTTGITASVVANAIGPATEAYAVGQTSLFVVHNATDSAVYLFKSAGHDANISAGELTRLAWLSHQTALTTTDFGFTG